jgi:RNA polymerase sigma-70 factor (ECF subfamily)
VGPRAPKSAAPTDAVGDAILARWRAGDDRAFTELFRAYRTLVYGVLRNLLPGDSELDDVVQTAFLEVFRSLDSFEGRSKLSSWVARVALHVGYHHLRRRRSRPADYRTEAMGEYLDERPYADPTTGVSRRETIHHVQVILSKLAPKKRTVFLLVDIQGLPQDEVAEIVGCSIATVRTRLFYARKEFWRVAAHDPVLAACADAETSTAESDIGVGSA